MFIRSTLFTTFGAIKSTPNSIFYILHCTAQCAVHYIEDHTALQISAVTSALWCIAVVKSREKCPAPYFSLFGSTMWEKSFSNSLQSSVQMFPTCANFEIHTFVVVLWRLCFQSHTSCGPPKFCGFICWKIEVPEGWQEETMFIVLQLSPNWCSGTGLLQINSFEIDSIGLFE